MGELAAGARGGVGGVTPDPARLAGDVAELGADPERHRRRARGARVARRRAQALGLEAELVEHDLAALRAHPSHPGEEAPRSEL